MFNGYETWGSLYLTVSKVNLMEKDIKEVEQQEIVYGDDTSPVFYYQLASTLGGLLACVALIAGVHRLRQKGAMNNH